MYKPVEEVQTALATRLPNEELKEVDGFKYVPWEVTARQLDSVFGPFGWSEEITHQQYDTDKGVYIVSRQITGYATVSESAGTDGEGQEHFFDHPVSITREGVGVGIAQARSDGQVSARAHDTAIKGADSDSLSRAAKKLGNAFGLFLYDRDDPARASERSNGNGSSVSSSRPPVAATQTNGGQYVASDGRAFSEKQTKFLADLGYSAQAISQMTYSQGKAAMEQRQKAPADALPF